MWPSLASQAFDVLEDFHPLFVWLVSVNLEHDSDERLQDLDHGFAELTALGIHESLDCFGVSVDNYLTYAWCVEMNALHGRADREAAFLQGIPDIEVFVWVGHVVKHGFPFCSYQCRQLRPQRGDVLRRYRARCGKGFSTSSGITMWTNMSIVRMKRQGLPNLKRLTGGCSNFLSSHSVERSVISGVSICLVIIATSLCNYNLFHHRKRVVRTFGAPGVSPSGGTPEVARYSRGHPSFPRRSMVSPPAPAGLCGVHVPSSRRPQ